MLGYENCLSRLIRYDLKRLIPLRVTKRMSHLTEFSLVLAYVKRRLGGGEESVCEYRHHGQFGGEPFTFPLPGIPSPDQVAEFYTRLNIEVESSPLHPERKKHIGDSHLRHTTRTVLSRKTSQNQGLCGIFRVAWPTSLRHSRLQNRARSMMTGTRFTGVKFTALRLRSTPRPQNTGCCSSWRVFYQCCDSLCASFDSSCRTVK